MNNTNTARDRLLQGMDPSLTIGEQEARVDAYRDEVIIDLCYGDARDVLARHRDKVLTKAAVQQREAAEALPDGDPLIPGLLHAAHLLLAARTTTAPTAQE